MLSSLAIVDLHDYWTLAWHQDPAQLSTRPAYVGLIDDVEVRESITAQHRANFDLWHIEDEARCPGATDADVAAVKRRIDQTNQQRNDLSEQIDTLLLAWLTEQDLPDSSAPLHSESPGLIIDRLSILSLKIYHTREEANRGNAPAGHGERNLARLSILEEQRSDLAICFDALWNDTLAGERRFKLYRQLKMYNDPSLNPAIYTKRPE